MRRTLVALLLFPLLAAGAGGEEDLKALLDGVEWVGKPGVPGPLCVFGPEAFPVIAGRADGRSAPLVAAARIGRGRVVAFGHNGYLDPAKSGAERLMTNAVRWAAGGGDRPPRVAVWRQRAAAAFLRDAGFEVEEVRDAAKPGPADVLVLDAGAIPDREAEGAIDKYLRSGGGLVAGSLGWGWRQVTGGKDLATEHPGNRLLLRAGIAWADGTLEPAEGDRYAAKGDLSPLLSAPAALDLLAGVEAGREKARRDDVALAAATVGRAIAVLPPEATFRVAVARIAREQGAAPISPTERAPLGMDRPLARVLLAARLRELAELPAAKVPAWPEADGFPGPVPPDAPRGERTVAVDTGVPGWTSTGLYAAPGECVVVRIPEGAAGLGLSLRIGCHTDRLWHHDVWKRVPEISAVFPLAAARTEVASAFGGLVYVVVPGRAARRTVPVAIAGAVLAPLFLAGSTDPEEWRRSIRSRPAPWAEIGSAKLIVSVPSRVVRGIDDPAELMAVWDLVLDLDAGLAARPAERDRPERIVCDVQISAGYMHSGYPIMTWMDQVEHVVDPAHLRKGNWGLFHELGHNHQSPDWTFGGTTEVTVNLFTLYVFDRLCGVPPERHERADAAARAKHMEGYLGHPDFGKWKEDPFLALTTYVQLQQAFGWEAFRDVFAEYRGLPEAERPKTDAEKRDQWLIRFSRRAGRDLGPFMARWGIPVSKAARDEVADLPPWMPDEMAE